MATSDQNPYQPPPEAWFAPTSIAPLAKKRPKLPWYAPGRLFLIGLAMAGLSFVFIHQIDLTQQGERLPSPLFLVLGFFWSVGGWLVIVYGPVWFITSLLSFMRSRSIRH